MLLFLHFLTASASLSKLFNLGGEFYDKSKSNKNILPQNLKGLKEVKEKGRVQKEKMEEKKKDFGYLMEGEEKEGSKEEEAENETEAEPQKETEQGKEEQENDEQDNQKNDNQKNDKQDNKNDNKKNDNQKNDNQKNDNQNTTTTSNNTSLLPTNTSLPPSPNKYTSHPHLKNIHSHKSLQTTLKAQKKAHHLRNTKIKLADLNYVKDKIKRNHNSHVHRVGSYANRAYYTYFSYHPGLRQSQWVFHNGHHGVVRGWHDVEDE